MTVERSWVRITDWLQQNAPTTAVKVRPPADRQAAAAAAAAFPVAWPAELREWYSLQDGASMGVLWRCVLPHWEILPLEDIVSQYEMWPGFSDGDGDGDGDEDGAPGLAGEMAFGFLPQFVPIGGDGCGNSLFVDLRPGPLHGCVAEYDAEEGTVDPSWPSVSRMLEDLADSLDSGVICDGWIPSVDEGELSWDLADAD